MKNAKAAGTRVEHKARRELEADGWIVIRAPASLGAADLIALKRGERPRFIQVKANAKGGAYANFRPRERQELRDIARAAGAVAELCYWPPRGEALWLDEAAWPS